MATAARRLILSVLICGAVMLVAALPAHAAFPGANGRIAFDTNRTGNWEIFSMNFDGSDPVNLTNNAALDQDAAWSPTGDRIAFTSNRDGNDEIYVMNASGALPTNISQNSASDKRPVWSPDGSQIAFFSNRSGTATVWVMGADGSNPTQLRTTRSYNPAWSPTGDKIAFQSDTDGDEEIWTMNADGTGATKLTSNSAEDASPNWSPYGDKIVFQTDRDKNSCSQACWRIYMMDPDGSPVTLVTANSSSDAVEPAWSPDRSRIAYRQAVSVPDSIAVVNADPPGSSKVVLDSSASGTDDRPDWQPISSYEPRPKGATPSRFSLVPAYEECLAPNRIHGPNIHHPDLNPGSCNPPTRSSWLTVGTPDANGAAPNSSGAVTYTALLMPAVADNDLQIDVNITDVRCGQATIPCGSANSGGGADYTGVLVASAGTRITDKKNGPSETEPATLEDMPYAVTVPCGATSATTIGSTCAVSTSAQALMGGKRAVWQFDEVEILDGGSDGDPNAGPVETLQPFMRPGVFIP